MKKFIPALAAIAAIALCSCNQNEAKDAAKASDAEETVALAPGSIVYFSLDKVLEEYDMANDLRSEVETKAAAIQKEVTRRQKNLENAVKDFQNKIDKGLITSIVAQNTQKKLQQQEIDFNQYAQTKQAEIMEEQQVMMNRLADAIKTFVEEYNVEKQYALILSNSAGVPVITGNSTLDITDEIIAGLNAKYVKEKKENKED